MKQLTGILAALLLSGTTVTSAEPPAARQVRLDDLDLETAVDRQVLESRLQRAAAEVCGLDVARGYADRQRARRCAAGTVAQALRRVVRESPRGPVIAAGSIETQGRLARK